MSAAEIVDSHPFEYPNAHLELMTDFPDAPPAVIDDAAERISVYRAAKVNRHNAFDAEEARLRAISPKGADVLGEVLLEFSKTYIDIYGNTVQIADRDKRNEQINILNSLLASMRTGVVRH